MAKEKCPDCNGTGREECDCTGGMGKDQADDGCPACGGTGKHTCTTCNGSGKIDV